MRTSRRELLALSALLVACSSSSAPEPRASLQAPPIQAPAVEVAVLQGAGSCVGPVCTMYFAAEARGDTETFISARCGDATCPASRGRLTEAAQAKARELGKQLAQVKLEEVYDCPGCADGPIGVAIVHRPDGKQTSHTFDPMHPEELPPPLRDAAALMEAVASAFDSCESTSLIEIGPECAQLKKQDEDFPTGRP
jgi:hypothetical protein